MHTCAYVHTYIRTYLHTYIRIRYIRTQHTYCIPHLNMVYQGIAYTQSTIPLVGTQIHTVYLCTPVYAYAYTYYYLCTIPIASTYIHTRIHTHTYIRTQYMHMHVYGIPMYTIALQQYTQYLDTYIQYRIYGIYIPYNTPVEDTQYRDTYIRYPIHLGSDYIHMIYHHIYYQYTYYRCIRTSIQLLYSLYQVSRSVYRSYRDPIYLQIGLLESPEVSIHPLEALQEPISVPSGLCSTYPGPLPRVPGGLNSLLIIALEWYVYRSLYRHP